MKYENEADQSKPMWKSPKTSKKNQRPTHSNIWGSYKSTKVKSIIYVQGIIPHMAQTHFGPVLGSSMCMCSYELQSIDLQGLVPLVSSFPSGYYTLSTFFFEGSPDLRGERFYQRLLGTSLNVPSGFRENAIARMET